MYVKHKSALGLLLTLIAALSAACDGGEANSSTPESGYVTVSDELLLINLNELVQDPQAYEGAYLQIEGQYRKLPLLFCNEDPQLAPTSWELASDDISIRAGGFDSQLRSLLANDTPMTVSGVWRRWQGTVGCGQRAVEQQIWYLQVDDIISPDPIIRISSLPAGPSNDTADLQPTPTISTTNAITATATLPPGTAPTDSSLSGTPTNTPVGTVLPTATGTPSPTPTTSPVAGSGQGTPTVTGTAVSSLTPGATSISPGTPTPTTTATSRTATPTPTITRFATAPTATRTSPTATQSPTATATTAAADSTPIDQGTIAAEEIVASLLETGQIHSWSFSIDAAETITVSAAAPTTGDIVLAVLDEADNMIAEQNQAGAGDVEMIAGLPLGQAGNYRLQVSIADGTAQPYSMMLLYSGSYAFVAQQILTYDTTTTGSIAEESDHFWFFEGDAGDSISITVIPADQGDLFLELYGANGDRISDFIDEGIGGEQEQLLGFELPDYGMYAIRVGEYEFNATNYQITLVRN